ncbi:protein of unknown function [Thermococcus nautili]|nr:protein of unknown function [Thermococcus nautili]
MARPRLQRLSILFESYCNGERIDQLQQFITLSILFESYCNRLPAFRYSPATKLSILFESYCNSVFSNLHFAIPPTFNSLRVLLQRSPSSMTRSTVTFFQFSSSLIATT